MISWSLEGLLSVENVNITVLFIGNVLITVLLNVRRTNNSVEGWHRGFNQLIASSHPTIWEFIDHLKKEQSLNEMKIEEYIAGQQPAVFRKIYRDTAKRVEDIVFDYENRNIFDFLRDIAINFNLQV